MDDPTIFVDRPDFSGLPTWAAPAGPRELEPPQAARVVLLAHDLDQALEQASPLIVGGVHAKKLENGGS